MATSHTFQETYPVMKFLDARSNFRTQFSMVQFNQACQNIIFQSNILFDNN